MSLAGNHQLSYDWLVGARSAYFLQQKRGNTVDG